MFDVRQATPDDEDLIRALRLQAILEIVGSIFVNLQRELTRTTDDWSRWD
jgi:hypothetical protein